MGLSFPEHSSHQDLLCNNLDLAGMTHGTQSHSLPYTQPDFDAGLAAGMASLGLQGSLMDSLQSTQWQASLPQSQDFLAWDPLASRSPTSGSDTSSQRSGRHGKLRPAGDNLQGPHWQLRLLLCSPTAWHLSSSMLSHSDEGDAGPVLMLLALASVSMPAPSPETSALPLVSAARPVPDPLQGAVPNMRTAVQWDWSHGGIQLYNASSARRSLLAALMEAMVPTGSHDAWQSHG